MLQYWDALQNALIDRSPAQFIGAIVVALTLALAVTGLYHLARRRVRDTVTLMTGLVVCSCLVSMLVTTGFLAHENAKFVGKAEAAPRGPQPPPSRPHGRFEQHLARRIVAVADRDGDGVLSQEEAVDATATFVQEAERSGARTLDAETLAHAIRSHIPPPPRPSGAMPPPWVPRAYEARHESSQEKEQVH